MTPAQSRNEIDRLISALYASSIAIDSNPTVSLSHQGTTIITWSNEVSLSSLYEKSSTFDEYIETVRRRWYSAVLFDGALLQLSYTFAGNTLKKHRLCFYPCPIQFSQVELSHFTIEELLEVLEGSDLKGRLRLEGPLRFDYDIDAAGARGHPPSHLTISRTSCRVPVSAPLSLGHFMRFLFLHFYPEHWTTCPDLRGWTCSAWDSCLPEIEKDQLYIHWRRRAT